MSRVVGIGACVMDTLITVPHFPAEDTKLRAEGTKTAYGVILVHCNKNKTPKLCTLVQQISNVPKTVSVYLCIVPFNFERHMYAFKCEGCVANFVTKNSLDIGLKIV